MNKHLIVITLDGNPLYQAQLTAAQVNELTDLLEKQLADSYKQPR